MKFPEATAAFFAIVASLHLATAVKYDNCDVVTYYAPVWNVYDAALLTDHLQTTHRDVIPYTSTAADCWDALIDLDVNPSNANEVKLVYRDAYVPAYSYGEINTWNREHLWPKSHGVDYSGPDYTDLHALRPSDWNVNAARSNRFFSSCGIAAGETMTDCVTPAHSEAAIDTQRDGTTFLPPASVRGDIARAMMYMAIRYDGSETNTQDLWLSDCPDANDPSEMGYLSQLLRWHTEDPVDDAERQRNERVCSNWQGNRNPFVDYPYLVEYYFGLPRADPAEGVGYDCSVSNPPGPPPPPPPPAPTSPPQAPPSSNERTTKGTCHGLIGGDIMVTGFRSDNPDAVVFVALYDLPEGAALYLTDNAWTGTAFKTNEGTKKVTIPVGGISAGSIFAYESGSTSDTSTHMLGDEWVSEAGSFALSGASDAIFVYCLDDGPDGTPSIPVHLTAVTYGADGWSQPNADVSTFSTGQSALPTDLPATAVVTLPHKDNYLYVGPRTGTLMNLRLALSDGSSGVYWDGHDSTTNLDVLHLNNQAPFAIEAESTPAPTSSPTPAPTPAPQVAPSGLGTCEGMVAGDVMVAGLNSRDPDEVAIVALADLPSGAIIYFTDSPWTGTHFKDSEGVKKLRVPAEGIPAGTVFGYGHGISDLALADAWETERGSLLLSSSNDSVMLYCLADDGTTPAHLSALDYSINGWEDGTGVDADFNSGSSALPSDLPADCAISLPHKDNYVFVGSKDGTKGEILSRLSNSQYWQGANGSTGRHALGFTLGHFVLAQ